MHIYSERKNGKHWSFDPRSYCSMKHLLAIAAFLFCRSLHGATYNSDGSDSDVQSKINSASDGDTVTIPSGSFTWDQQISISGKGIHLQGAGSGRVVGRSTTSTTVGTGSKTWTVGSGLPISNGQSVTVERLGGVISGGNPTGARASMSGEVTSYSGTSLTVDVTSTVGSGTHPLWYISSAPTTTVIHSYSGLLMDITEDSTHHVRMSGIKFKTGSAGGGYVQISSTTGGKAVLFHDNYFELSHSADVIRMNVNRGVFWRMDLVACPFAGSSLGVHTANTPNSWTNLSTMGTNDTTGESNIYMEDCYAIAWRNSTDFDNNARAVVRHSTLDNSGVGTHGADSSSYGLRHLEVYKCTFLWNGYGDGQSLPLNQWFLWRGGTGLIASNAIDNLCSTDFSDKPEIRFCVWNIDHAWGPNPCWGADIPGVQYPCPRTVGMGRVTGAAGNDSITYIGDVEPLYVWQNTWSACPSTYTALAIVESYGTTDCTNPDTADDYIQQGRDIYTNNVAKPNWVPYTYPHPLREEQGGGEPPAPGNLRVLEIRAGRLGRL